MTPAEFRKWMERHGLTVAQAADALALQPNTVKQYRSGRRRVSDRTERLMVRYNRRNFDPAKLMGYNLNSNDVL